MNSGNASAGQYHLPQSTQLKNVERDLAITTKWDDTWCSTTSDLDISDPDKCGGRRYPGRARSKPARWRPGAPWAAPSLPPPSTATPSSTPEAYARKSTEWSQSSRQITISVFHPNSIRDVIDSLPSGGDGRGGGEGGRDAVAGCNKRSRAPEARGSRRRSRAADGGEDGARGSAAPRHS
jgi:hypothetical protein